MSDPITTAKKQARATRIVPEPGREPTVTTADGTPLSMKLIEAYRDNPKDATTKARALEFLRHVGAVQFNRVRYEASEDGKSIVRTNLRQPADQSPSD